MKMFFTCLFVIFFVIGGEPHSLSNHTTDSSDNNVVTTTTTTTPFMVKPAFTFFHRRYFNLLPHQPIEWTVTSFSIYLDRDFTIREIEKAFKVWSDVSNLHFVFKPRKIDCNILIGFVQENVHEMIGSGERCQFNSEHVIAHAYFPPIHEIHIRDAKNYFKVNRDAVGPSLFATMVHEIGHILSLRHSKSSDSIMYHEADVLRTKYTNLQTPLTAEDKERISNIYGWRRTNINFIL